MNFTAFRQVEIDFGPGINAIIGENATGKTNLLKAMYSLANGAGRPEGMFNELEHVFLLSPLGYQELSHRVVAGQHWGIRIDLGDQAAYLTTEPKEGLFQEVHDFVGREPDGGWLTQSLDAVYIQAKDILSHSMGFRSLFARRKIHYDGTYTDVLDQAFMPPLRELPPESEEVLERLQIILGGQVQVRENDQVIVNFGNYELQLHLVAEGLHKFALLWLLVSTGALKPGSILFWDEPEANLNPKLMREIVEVILLLKRMGIQIFFATHDYVVLKWLDLLGNGEPGVLYHTLAAEGPGVVRCESADNLLDLKQNAILDIYAELYDAELKRTMERISHD
jgi:energy-coupling factor transporter ATP-binding protein EcfA2